MNPLREALAVVGERIAGIVRLFGGPGTGSGELPRLKSGDLLGISAADVDATLARTDRRGSAFLLGVLAAETVRRVLEEHGVLPRLRARVGSAVEIAIDASDPAAQSLRIDRADGGPPGPDSLLVELRLRRETRSVPAASGSGSGGPGCPVFPACDLLATDWLLLQDPGAPLSEERPRLPGQRFRGLGIGREVMEVAILAAKRLGLDGVLGVPHYYHNAVMYAPYFAFIEPEAQGELEALRRDLAEVSLGEAAWAVHDGRVRVVAAIRSPAGATFAWRPTDMIMPISQKLRDDFDDPGYRERAAAALSATRFALWPPAPAGPPEAPGPSAAAGPSAVKNSSVSQK